MVEINVLSRRAIVLAIAAIIIQGCATTDELFAEYDSEFCVGESTHRSATDPTAKSCQGTVEESHLSLESVTKNPVVDNQSVKVPAFLERILSTKPAQTAQVSRSTAAVAEVKTPKAEEEVSVASAETEAVLTKAKAKSDNVNKVAKAKSRPSPEAEVAIVEVAAADAKVLADDHQIVEVPASVSQVTDARQVQNAETDGSPGTERLTLDLGVSGPGSTEAERLTIDLGLVGEGSSRVKRLTIDLGVSDHGTTRAERVVVDLEDSNEVSDSGKKIINLGLVGSDAECDETCMASRTAVEVR